MVALSLILMELNPIWKVSLKQTHLNEQNRPNQIEGNHVIKRDLHLKDEMKLLPINTKLK